MAKKIINQTKLRDLIIARGKGAHAPFSQSYYDRIINLLLNAIKIECSDTNIEFGFCEEAFVKKALIEKGCAGYDVATKKWFYASGENINQYGYPTRILLTTATGLNYRRKAIYKADTGDGAYIVYAMPMPYSVSGYIDDIANVLGQCDASALQNILATKTPAIFVCSNDDIRLSVEHAIQDIQDGKPALIVSNELADAIKGITTNTEYIADRLELYKKQRYDAILNELGVLTSVDKAERVQSAEVNASIGECKDYISIWIDTFNKQMETYDLPFKMSINNALEEMYKPLEDMDKSINGLEASSQNTEIGVEENGTTI